MTPEQLAEIRARLDAATPGPWRNPGLEPGSGDGRYGIWAGPYRVARVGHCDYEGSAANAALIAHAPTDLRALLDEVERLTVERDRLREALRPFAALAGVYDPPDGDDGSVCWADLPTIGDLRRARAALAPNT